MTSAGVRTDARLLKPGAVTIDLDEVRSRRRALLRAAAGDDGPELRQRRSYPVLAVLSPVMTTAGSEVSFPGDPMCLYAALGVAVRSAVESLDGGLVEGARYNDLVPGWGRFPDDADRARESAVGTPAAAVFDPRVWDADARAQLVGRLRRERPRVVLISSVSGGFRHAVAIASLVRRHRPGALVVLGGRHADETTRFDAQTSEVVVSSASPAACVEDGRIEPVFDVVVSGQGAYALDAVLRALSLVLEPGDEPVSVPAVREALAALVADGDRIAGVGVVSFVLADGTAVAMPFAGDPVRLADLPSPYRAFPIRARFAIFDGAGSCPRLTAHVMTADTCPFRCCFCSEGRGVSGPAVALSRGEERLAVERLCEVVHYGAEAAYFDDPVFWGGRFGSMVAFCEELGRLRADLAAGRGPGAYAGWIVTDDDRRRMVELEWGAQFTAGLIAPPDALGQRRAHAALAALAAAGCSYVYVGIESLAESVMAHVHKNRSSDGRRPWAAQVRHALTAIHDAGMRAGSSVLFGLEGETARTVEETIEEVGRLIDEGLLDLASPNLLTYHPNTPVARDRLGVLDYHSELPNRPPYSYFEEAFPGLVSHALDEQAIWTIHRLAERRWGHRRNAEGRVGEGQAVVG